MKAIGNSRILVKVSDLEDWLDRQVMYRRVTTAPGMMRMLYPQLWSELVVLCGIVRGHRLSASSLPPAGNDGVRETMLSSLCERIMDRVEEVEGEERESWLTVHAAARRQYQRKSIRKDVM